MGQVAGVQDELRTQAKQLMRWLEFKMSHEHEPKQLMRSTCQLANMFVNDEWEFSVKRVK